MSGELTLYDLPSKGKSACWSLNPWKARMALNYKGIPYKTEWVEYPDIASKYKELGIEANPSGARYPYSIPGATLPDGTSLQDSLKIAQALEELQPKPSLHLDNGYTDRTQQLVLQIFSPLAAICLPRLPRDLLPPRSAEYFVQTRATRFGMPLDQVEHSDKGGETAWAGAEPAMRALKALLAENGGPYVAGREASFADFVLAGLWRFAEVVGREDVFPRLMGYDASFKQHYEVCRQWMERDD